MKYPWMPLFWGDFLANTMHLSAQEAGAYLFLIAHAWENNGRIPGEPVRLARIAHVRQDRWKQVWNALQHFFEPEAVGPVITGPSDHWALGYRHTRVTTELHRLGKIANKRKGSAVQMHSKCTANAEQMQKAGDANAPTSTSTSNRESSLNGKEGSAPSVHVQVNYLDKGVEYRSPPRAKSDNVLTPLPDKVAKSE